MTVSLTESARAHAHRRKKEQGGGPCHAPLPRCNHEPTTQRAQCGRGEVHEEEEEYECEKELEQ